MVSIKMSIVLLFSVSQLPVGRAAILTSSSRAAVNFEFTAVPRWSAGMLIAVDYQATGAPLIRLFGRDGHEGGNLPLLIPQAQTIVVRGIARGDSGLVAACGRAIDKDGRQSAFLALLPPNGGAEKLIALNEYYAESLAVVSDDTVWTQGYFTSNDNRSGVFRHFDQAGLLIGSLVPESTFASKLHLADPGNGMAWSGGRVGWYSPGEGRYIEISSEGKLSADLKTPVIQGEKMTGFALTEDGQVFLSTQTNSHPIHPVLYSLDKESGELRKEAPPEPIRLYGADGNSVVGVTHTAGLQFLTVQKQVSTKARP